VYESGNDFLTFEGIWGNWGQRERKTLITPDIRERRHGEEMEQEHKISKNLYPVILILKSRFREMARSLTSSRICSTFWVKLKAKSAP